MSMRDIGEIQKAHDILVAHLMGDLPNVELAEEELRAITAAADVLCWVLRHDHNDTFARNLEMLEKAAEDAGYSIVHVDEKGSWVETEQPGN